MKIRFSDEFKKEFKKISNKDMRNKIIKQIQKLKNKPKSGKPLKHKLKRHRSLRVTPYRIVYRLETTHILINCIDHRKDIYK